MKRKDKETVPMDTPDPEIFYKGSNLNPIHIVLAFVTLLCVSCSTSPRFKLNDCFMLSAMEIDSTQNWTSKGRALGEFRIIGKLTSNKPNRYMAKRLHAKRFYIVQTYDMTEKTFGTDTYVIPVKDLEGYRYATKFWTMKPGECNSYSKKRKD